MTQQAISRLSYLCSIIPPLFDLMPDDELSLKPSPDKWSKKEVLGHLVDSAANNHQRFIRIQFEETPAIFYDQENWVKYSHYNQLQKDHIIQLWAAYNKHLVEVVKRIPDNNLLMECRMRDGRQVTLEWLINDYVGHMEHHLKQIITY